jgi:hypothetical protein
LGKSLPDRQVGHAGRQSHFLVGNAVFRSAKSAIRSAKSFSRRQKGHADRQSRFPIGKIRHPLCKAIFPPRLSTRPSDSTGF